MIFALEVALVASLSFIFFRTYFVDHRLLVALIGLWGVACFAIFIRYGYSRQLLFYSNDQVFHQHLVLNSNGRLIPTSFKEILADRMPYITPAYILSLAGFSVPVALKSISLASYLSLVVVIQNHLRDRLLHPTKAKLLLTVGPAVFFFSTLALREVTMALFVTYAFVGRSLTGRVASLVGLLMLRPHLAFAVAVALILKSLWGKNAYRHYFVSLGITTATTVLAGVATYQFEFARRLNKTLDFQLITSGQLLQLFGSFTGLQFLWADLDAINKSFLEVLVPRLIFPDTILLPLLFIFALSIPVISYRNTKFGVLIAFGIYTGIVSSYDVQSFRQYLPLIPVMGICVIEVLWNSRVRQWITLRSLPLQEERWIWSKSPSTPPT